MIDDKPNATPQETLRVALASSKAQFRKRVAVAVLITGVIICSGLITLNYLPLSNPTASFIDTPKIEQEITETIDGYLRSMANKNIDQARTYTSGRFQDFITQSSVEGMRYVSYDGYTSILVTDLSISIPIKQNAEFLQKRVTAQVNAIIHYKGDFSGVFNGALEERDGKWVIGVYSLNVSPDKERAFIKQHPGVQLTPIEFFDSGYSATELTPDSIMPTTNP
jgi:hypothetical protein